ncbi:retropepsin-like aspartic protease [Bergeyella sp. RCAD1439]|uniref:retropepsin-like aspartic protease n=1 Tax=Bergeyella anatis TaxID=3113737 RepID=UPI002E17DDBD|nr:retropepsin-like aspartic protease [Bergeyella sp. RCAD1439]
MALNARYNPILFFGGMIPLFIQGQISPNYKDRIDFELVNDRAVFVEATIQNKPLAFFFDTGATTALLDRNSANELGLKPNHQTKVTGAGGDKVYDLAANQEVIIGQTKLEGVHLVFDDMEVFRKQFERPFDGIIGHSLLSKYQVEMNFDQKRFYLYDFETALDVSDYTEIPFEFGNDIPIPQFDIEIKANGKAFKGRILFDSGAGLTLLLNTPFSKENQLPSSAQKKLTTSARTSPKNRSPPIS